MLAALACFPAYGHVVSVSYGELRITGTTAAYQLRIPGYEVPPGTDLFPEIRFGAGVLTSSKCDTSQEWYTCDATYAFPQPVTDTLEVECTLYRVTVPNHIHILYAAVGENGDQQIFDQSSDTRELRFHPPSAWESFSRDGLAGMRRLMSSIATLLFLVAVVLAARTAQEALLLSVLFLSAEWGVRLMPMLIAPALSPEFLEALMALTVAYLAGELLFLPDGRARWFIVPVLGLFHGLPYMPYPPMYLAGAAILQIVLLSLLSTGALRMPRPWRKPAGGGLLLAAGLWFARFLIA